MSVEGANLGTLMADTNLTKHEGRSQRCCAEWSNSLAMSQAESLDDIALGVPAHADVLVAVCANNKFVVFREDERCEQRRVSEDERAVRRVFVRNDRVPLVGCGCLLLLLIRSKFFGVGMKRITVTMNYNIKGKA